MNNWMQGILFVLFMLASALFSGMETGGYLLNRLRLQFRVRQNERAAVRLQRALRDAHLFIFTVLIGNNIAVYCLSRQVTNWYLASGMAADSGGLSWNAETAATVTLMLPLFIFAELLPKNLFRTYADRLMYRVSWLLQGIQFIFWPLTMSLKGVFHFLTAGKVPSEALSGLSLSLEGLREYFTGDTLQKTLTDHQHGMMDNLVSMHRISTREVMTPWKSVVSVSERSSVRQVLERMKSQGLERILIYRGARRNLVGVVSAIDLLEESVELGSSVKPYVNLLPRISGGTALPQAFRRLREILGAPILVMDRPGKVGGVLYLRDVAGHIVAED